MAEERKWRLRLEQIEASLTRRGRRSFTGPGEGPGGGAGPWGATCRLISTPPDVHAFWYGFWTPLKLSEAFYRHLLEGPGIEYIKLEYYRCPTSFGPATDRGPAPCAAHTVHGFGTSDAIFLSNGLGLSHRCTGMPCVEADARSEPATRPCVVQRSSGPRCPGAVKIRPFPLERSLTLRSAPVSSSEARAT